MTEETTGTVWFVYDGDCPICRMAAEALRIRTSVGRLVVVNARENRNHPLVREIGIANLDLDEGMVLKYGDRLYHGAQALTMMGLLGSHLGWFNRLNAALFRSNRIARFCYPFMKTIRNMLLRTLGVGKINLHGRATEQPLFARVFGKDWEKLPDVMKKHYAARPRHHDRVTVAGALDVQIKPYVKLMARLSGALLAHSGEGVPTTVEFTCAGTNDTLYFHRVFQFPEAGVIDFKSRMVWLEKNIVVEFMRFGVGWKVAFSWEDGKVILRHRGYVWNFFDILIPIPLSVILGKGYAEEIPLSEDRFRMETYTLHPLLGKTFGYFGEFKIVDVTCNPS